MPGERSLYSRIEALHLRQGLQRVVPLVGALALNGVGWLDLPGLPRPHRSLGAAPAGSAADAALALSGAALVAVAASLRVAAKGVLVRKRTVTRSGVYGRVRHPYYLANLLGSAGILLVAGLPGAAAAVAWLAAATPVFLVTVRGEEAGLRRDHPDAWDAYAARVPRLVPSVLSRTVGDPTPVTWRNLVAEHEPPRLCRFVAGALAVVSCRFDGAAAWSWGAAAAALFLASHVLALATRRSR